MLKSPKTSRTAKQAHFEIFRKKSKYMPRVVLAGESKTGLSFEIGQPQQKIWRKPSLQSIANPAVRAFDWPKWSSGGQDMDF